MPFEDDCAIHLGKVNRSQQAIVQKMGVQFTECTWKTA